MQIKVTVSTGLVGSKREAVIEVEDGLDEDGIEELAREAMFEMINWGWSPVEEEKPAKKGGRR